MGVTSANVRPALYRSIQRLRSNRELARRGITLVLLLALPNSTQAHGPDAVGGGLSDSGLLGSYYANPNLEGEPAFTRRDVRIAFDWRDVHPVGGSTAEPYRSFPTDGFSVRWTGRVVPRFSEPYRFVGEADDGIRIKLRKPGERAGNTLVDRWTAPGTFASDPVQLIAGQLYEIEVEYRESTGKARCLVAWESPSTPREVVDPVVQQGLNASSFAPFVWADSMKTARYGEKAESVDVHGWPTQDGTELVMSEWNANDAELSGTYSLRFKGKAQVRESCCTGATFEADGRAYKKMLPAGAGYDPRTNSTSAKFKTRGSRTMLFLENTSRGGGSRGRGVTDIRLMRPLTPGSDRTHDPTEVVYRPFKSVLQEAFTSVRWLKGANGEGEVEWSSRTLPGHSFFSGGREIENWEYLVMLSNETGNDLYITTPISANDEYFRKLALLLRYGSDGREPYPGPTANPVYPPLNPNLRVYIEVGNEIWNWAFRSTQASQRLTASEAEKDSPTWTAINYDGHAGNPQHMRAVRRWHALRTVELSNAFRAVWGDDAMGSTVRVLIEYQYDNFQNSAAESLTFIDDYFGNPPNEAGKESRPVSYYVWGGGGATYYGLHNKTGSQTHTVFRDPSFEKPSIAAGTRVVRPSGSPWTFRGTAGIVRPGGAATIQEIEKPVEPETGQQAAFILGSGSISQRLRFTEPGEYAVSFRAVGPDTGWPPHLLFDIYIDDVKYNPRDQTDIRVTTEVCYLRGWARPNDSFKGEWGSAVFRVDRPGERKVEFVGAGGSGYLLLDDIRISSVDAILDSGFRAGEALGQVSGEELGKQFEAQAKYPRTFGLQVVAYEAGWSVGGDFRQVPIQNWAKFKDDRTQMINDRMIELWDESGSFMNIWGVYRFWPEFDLVNATSYPLMRSLGASSRRLRAEATSGKLLPASLSPKDADWVHVPIGASGWRRYLPWRDKKGWFSWMLVAPATGDYSVQVKASGEGSLVVEFDGETALRVTELKSPLPTTQVRLTKGAHAVRVVTAGDVEIQSVEIRD
ncbi:MAG: PA14 domain-containing protein [Myxococcales bacterium]|nr:PA14 domain-containing protein [Myxococcales bacterium]MDH3484853.1 PA14 domain-containing protein [Myxococcales bacterium]